jgi:hypothetical protein
MSSVVTTLSIQRMDFRRRQFRLRAIQSAQVQWTPHHPAAPKAHQRRSQEGHEGMHGGPLVNLLMVRVSGIDPDQEQPSAAKAFIRRSRALHLRANWSG